MSASSALIEFPAGREGRIDSLRPRERKAEDEATPRTTSTDAMVTCALSTLPVASEWAGSAGL